MSAEGRTIGRGGAGSGMHRHHGAVSERPKRAVECAAGGAVAARSAEALAGAAAASQGGAPGRGGDVEGGTARGRAAAARSEPQSQFRHGDRARGDRRSQCARLHGHSRACGRLRRAAALHVLWKLTATPCKQVGSMGRHDGAPRRDTQRREMRRGAIRGGAIHRGAIRRWEMRRAAMWRGAHAPCG